MGMPKEKAKDLVSRYGSISGAMIGGRVGYMLGNGCDQLINNPLKLHHIWEGGHAPHGGLIGVIIAMWNSAKQNRNN